MHRAVAFWLPIKLGWRRPPNPTTELSSPPSPPIGVPASSRARGITRGGRWRPDAGVIAALAGHRRGRDGQRRLVAPAAGLARPRNPRGAVSTSSNLRVCALLLTGADVIRPSLGWVDCHHLHPVGRARQPARV